MVVSQLAILLRAYEAEQKAAVKGGKGKSCNLPEVQRNGPRTLQRQSRAGTGASSMRGMPCFQESAYAHQHQMAAANVNPVGCTQTPDLDQCCIMYQM